MIAALISRQHIDLGYIRHWLSEFCTLPEHERIGEDFERLIPLARLRGFGVGFDLFRGEIVDFRATKAGWWPETPCSGDF